MNLGNCEICGEFDCDIDHDEENEIEPDEGYWLFDGSGMISDN